MCRQLATTIRARTASCWRGFRTIRVLDYLEWLRWPDGFRCPRCVGRAALAIEQRSLGVHRVCGRQTSVTAGRSSTARRTPLRLWFAAAWEMTGQKHGVSALGLQRSLGLGSYQTAWAMLHRFGRRWCARPRPSGRTRRGRRGVLGRRRRRSVRPGRRPPSRSSRSPLRSSSPRGFGRIRLQRVDDVSKDSLIPFIESAVEPGATVHTDGWQAYWTVPDRGLRARADDHARPARPCSCCDARRSSSREPAQTLVARHAPGIGRTATRSPTEA